MRVKKTKSNRMGYIETTSKKLIIVAFSLIIMQTAISLAASAPDSSLAAYWKFDENTGTTAYDSSGNNNNGTVSGATWTAGKIGNALSFNGVNGYVNAGNGASLNIIGNKITIEAWVYPKTLSESYIVSKYNGDTVTSGYNFLITQSNIYFRLGNGTTRYQLVSPHGMSTNTWYHVVAVYDGTSMKIYKNGAALPGSTSFSGNIGTSSYNVNIGQRADNSYRWNGSIDEVRIYNRALSASEILADYNAGLSDTTPPTVTISSPANGQTLTNPSITVSGTASDNVAVSKVEVKLNSGTFQLATGTTNWNIPLTLISGSNTITTRATDTSNNTKETSITLTYTLSDTTPPAISAISSSNITSTSATIFWITNEASDTQVEYGTTTSYGSSTILDMNLVTSHSQSLSGLSASTLYHYRVKSKDPSGNLATSGDYTFTTVSVPTGPLKLTIDHTKIDAPLSDFPVLIHLGKSSGINSADTSFVLASLGTDANRKKISVTTASGTQLYVEIEKWDSANKEAWLWVKVPSISNTQDTVLYLNYDPSMADNTAMVGDTRSTPAENVWSNGFVMVQHFEQSGSGNTGEFLDSTKRHHNGQGGEGSSSGTPVKVASNIGYGQSFDGISDFISVPDSDDFSVTTTCQFTFSVWINLGAQNFNSSDSYIRWIGKGDNSGNWEWHSVLYNQNANDPDRLRQYDYGPTGGLGAGDYSTSSFAVGQWRHITGVNTCSDASHGNEWLYVDGVHTGLPQTWQTYGFTYANGVAPLRIGNARGFNGKDWFNGKMDEVRISNVSRSQAWIKAEYYADSDALLS